MDSEMQDIKFMAPGFNRSALRIYHNDPNTVIFVTQKGWMTTKYFDYCLKSGINHESIHSVLIKMDMKKESTAFDKIFDKFKKTQEQLGFFDSLF